MTQHSISERTIALAGVFQAAIVVNDIASKGIADSHDLETCIKSLLITDTEKTIDIFGRVDYLRSGLFALIDHLDNSSKQKQVDIARYVITLLHLQRKLMKRGDLLEVLDKGIERAKSQAEIYSPLHENVIANLADIYSNTLSQIPPKIMVSGEVNFLNNPSNANKIRALLLAGLRAAVLWSQVGGGRWQVLFKRKLFVQAAHELLKGESPELET